MNECYDIRFKCDFDYYRNNAGWKIDIHSYLNLILLSR